MCEFWGRACEFHSLALASERSSSVQRTHRMTDFFFHFFFTSYHFFPSSARERLASVVRPCCWLGRECLSSDSCWHYRPGRGTQTCTGRSITGAGATLVSAVAPDVDATLLGPVKSDSARGKEAGRLHLQDPSTSRSAW